MKYKTKSRLSLVLILLILVSSLPTNVIANNIKEKDTGIRAYKENQRLGSITISVEKFSIKGSNVLDPIEYPLYEGDNLARIFDYVMGYIKPISNINDAHSLKGSSSYKNEGNFKSGFKITSVENIDKDTELKTEVKRYASENNLDISEIKDKSAISNGDINPEGKWIVRHNNEISLFNMSELTSFLSKGHLKDGDVIRIQYSPFGDNLNFENKVNKDNLAKVIGKINKLGGHIRLKSGKKLYNEAINIFNDLSSSQEEINAITKKLQKDIDLDIENKRRVSHENMLLGNTHYKMKTGDEFELVALSLPGADDSDRNFVRDDLFIEPVKGKNKVSIKRVSGEKSKAEGNSNMKLGSTYFVKALEEGIVKLKVSHPEYRGRDQYVLLHITNRKSDYEKFGYRSTFDYMTKYDTIHFIEEDGSYDIDFWIPQDEKGSYQTRITINGLSYDPMKNEYLVENDGKMNHFKVPIKLKNGYNDVIITTQKYNGKTYQYEGPVSKKVYNIRASHLTPKIWKVIDDDFVLGEEIDGDKSSLEKPDKLYEGDRILINFEGLIQPLPKVSRLYNPSQAIITYDSDLPRRSIIRGYSSQYDLETSGILLELTGHGKKKLYNGRLNINRFGSGDWAETPINQIPEYTGPEPEITGGEAGNAPQLTSDYSVMPDIELDILPNEDYNPETIKVDKNKDVYKEKDEVVLNIEDLDLNELHENHNKYYDKDSDYYHLINSIQRAKLEFKTNIPGLEVISSEEVTNNFEGATVEDLKDLKTIRFNLPENIKSGNYKIYGGRVLVEYGPTWWLKYKTYFDGLIDDVDLKVERKPKSVDKKHGQIDSISFIHTDNQFLIKPELPVDGFGNKSTAYLSSDELNNSENEEIEIITKDPHINISNIEAKKRGVLEKIELIYKKDGKYKKKEYFFKGLKNLEVGRIPLKLGVNKVKIKTYTTNKTTALGEEYKFSIKRKEKDIEEKDNRNLLSELAIASESKYGELMNTDGVLINLNRNIGKGKNKFDIDVNNYVDKIRIGATSNAQVDYYGHNAKIYLNDKLLNKSNKSYAFNNYVNKDTGIYELLSNPLGSLYSSDVITLKEGNNNFIIKVVAENGDINKYELNINRMEKLGLKDVSIKNGKLGSKKFYPGVENINLYTNINESKYYVKYEVTNGEKIYEVLDDGKEIELPSGEYVEYNVKKNELPNLGKHKIKVEKDNKRVYYNVNVYEHGNVMGEVIEYKQGIGQFISMIKPQFRESSDPYSIFRKGMKVYGKSQERLTYENSVNLGSIGGTITYKLNQPIENNPKNPYGIDFKVFTNLRNENLNLSSNQIDNYTEGAIGVVEVAQDTTGDGKPDKWYLIDGSERNSKNIDYNYSIKYKNVGKYPYYIDSYGKNGYFILSNSYPSTLFTDRFNGREGDEFTYTGVRIKEKNPKFGYIGVSDHELNKPYEDYKKIDENPYEDRTVKNGDGIDISWAVDEKGRPVYLDKIDFIRFTTAEIDNEMDLNKEQATELVMITDVDKDDSVSITSAPKHIKINGEELELEKGKYIYNYYTNESDLVFNIDHGMSNIYVENQSLVDGVDSDPIKNKNQSIRIIVQEEDYSPAVYTVNIKPKKELESLRIGPKKLTLVEGEEFDINYQLSPANLNIDSSDIRWNISNKNKEYLSVEDGKLKAIKASNGKEIVVRASYGNLKDEIKVKVIKDNKADKVKGKIYLLEFNEEKNNYKIGEEFTEKTINNMLENSANRNIKLGYVYKENGVEKVIYRPEDLEIKIDDDLDVIRVEENGDVKFDEDYIGNVEVSFSFKPFDSNFEEFDISMNLIFHEEGSIKNIKDKIRELEELDKYKYTEDSWENLKEVIKDVKNYTNLEWINKDLEEELISKLNKAKNNLVEEAEDIVGNKKYLTISVDLKTIGKGYILKPMKVEYIEGDSLWDVSKRAFDEKEISYEYTTSKEYNSIYVESISNVGEFDNGPLSGWMVNVNGEYPNVGVSNVYVKEGDIIEWRYTTDLGIDLGINPDDWIDDEGEDGEKEPSNPERPNENNKPETPNDLEKPDKEDDKDKPSKPNIKVEFKDIHGKELYWAKNSIINLANKGIIEGRDKYTYSPHDNITRAEFTSLMVRILKLGKSEKNPRFKDVSKKDWYYKSIQIAYKAGLIEGYDDGLFRPNDTITREEISMILSRVIDNVDPKELKDKNILKRFKDNNEISSWVRNEMSLLVELELLEGYDDFTIKPKNKATRAEIAVLLERFIKNIDI